MSFRRLIRNLRKMQEAKDAVPAMVPRDVADRLADALGPVLTISDRKHDAWDEAKQALAEYRKATQS